MPFCHGCGNEVPPAAAYCLGCGRALAHAQPMYGQGPGPAFAAPPIPNHLPLAIGSIVVGFLCCLSLPLGVVAIINATQVDPKRAAGDIAGALAASKNARTWAIVSYVVGGIGGVVALGLNALQFITIFNGPTGPFG